MKFTPPPRVTSAGNPPRIHPHSPFYRFRRIAFVIGLASVAALLPGQPAQAGTVLWDGDGGDGVWSTAANWTGDTLPGSGDVVLLDNSLATLLPTPMSLDADFTLQALDFNTANTLAIQANSTGNPARILTLTGDAGNVLISAQGGGSFSMQPADGTLSIILANDGTLDIGPGCTLTTNNSNNLEWTGSTITKTGAGTLVLAGSGGGGTGGIFALSNGAVLSASGLNFGTAALVLGDAGNHPVFASADASSHSFANTLHLVGNITFGQISGGTGALTFSGATSILNSNTSITTDAATTISGVLGDGGSGFSLTKSGADTLTLAGANTYSGATIINDGILEVSTLTNGGVNSGIGNSSGAATNLILNGGTLRYTGGTTSTDRGFALGTNGGAIDASGAANADLVFANTAAMDFNGQTGARTLTLTGSSTGANTMAAAIGDNGGATSLVKSGNGTWILTNTNSFTGTFTLNGGILNAGAANINAGDVTNGIVFNGGTLQAATGGIATGKAVTMAGNGTFSNAIGDDFTLSGVIDGAGALTKSGTGVLTLSGANTYSGGTSLSAGVLQLGASSTGSITDGPVGTGALSIGNGATLSSDSATARSIANAISFDGNVTLGNAANDGLLTFTGAGTLTAGSTLTLDSDVIYSGNIGESGGAHSLSKNGTGVLTLSGTNTYSSGTTVNAGQLNINNAAALGTGPLVLNAATIDNTSGSAVAVVNNDGTISLNGSSLTFGGTNDLTFGNGNVNGSVAKTITLGGTNSTLTFGGPLRNTAHSYNTLTINGAGNTISFGGFVLDVGGTGATTQTIIGDGNVTFTGAIADGTSTGRSLTYNGTGQLTISAASTFTGSLTATTGTVLLDDADALASAALSSNGGDIRFSSGIGTFHTKGLLGAGDIVLNDVGGSPVNIFLRNSTGKSYTGVMSGGGSVTMGGTSSQTLGGASIYTGGTVVSSGILQIGANSTVDGGGALASGPIGVGTLTIGDGGTVRSSSSTTRTLQNNMSLSGTVTLGSTSSSYRGTLVFNSAGLATPATAALTADTTINSLSSVTISNEITGAHSLSKSGTGTLTLGGANTYTGATNVLGGTLALASTGTLASTAISIANGATFNVGALSGGYVLSGIGLTISTDGTAKGLLNAGSIALTLGGDLVVNISSSLIADGGVDLMNFGSKIGNFDTVSLGGAYTGSLLRTDDLWTGTSGGYSFSFDQSNGAFNFASVPEPCTYALALPGLLLVCLIRRHRRRMALA